jgi:hypothetical protein
MAPCLTAYSTGKYIRSGVCRGEVFIDDLAGATPTQRRMSHGESIDKGADGEGISVSRASSMARGDVPFLFRRCHWI